jgi:hypothetical protein
MNLLWLLASYFRTQRALQWWSQRQSIQLAHEAKKIRDGLLQESFTMRRSLELSLLEFELSTNRRQDWLKKIDKFHHSLEQLSDCLYPAYIEDSLPLAINCVVESWQTYNQRLKFETELPRHWRHEPPERSLIILKVLDELIRIISSESLTEILIHISLKLQGKVGELMVHISYPDLTTLVFYSNLKDLEYLSQTFQFLTSGQCFRRRKDLTVAWYFRWVTQEDKPVG